MSLQKVSFEEGFISDAADWMNENKGLVISHELLERLEQEDFLSNLSKVATNRVNSGSFNLSREWDMLKGLTDFLNISREEQANVIQLLTLTIDTASGLLASSRRHSDDMTFGARLVFPCKELFRSPASHPEQPRNWQAIWESNGGNLYNGRMIALIDDPIWSNLSRFGLPYPPFDYDSGMLTVSVSREEAVSLGVIEDD